MDKLAKNYFTEEEYWRMEQNSGNFEEISQSFRIPELGLELALAYTSEKVEDFQIN